MQKFKSRKFLLALFGQLAGVGVLFFPEHESQVEAAVSHAGALLLMALTAVGWIKAEGDVDRERTRGEAADRDRRERMAQEPAASAQAAPALWLLAAMLAVGGCATSPQDRWHQAQDALTTTRTAILAQHEAGNLSDRELVRLDEYEKAARTALEAAEPIATDPDAGDDDDLRWHLDLAERMLERMIEYLGPPEHRGTLDNPDTPTSGGGGESEDDDDGSGATETGGSDPRDSGHRPRAAGVRASAGGDARRERPARRRAA